MTQPTNSRTRILFFIGLIGILLLVAWGILSGRNGTPIEDSVINPAKEIIVYKSETECVAAQTESDKKCRFVKCDYVPKGKTFDEVCGKNFKKGWQVN